MTERDSRRVLEWIDSSLEVFKSYEGRLTVTEVRLRSLLIVTRGELLQDLDRSLKKTGAGIASH